MMDAMTWVGGVWRLACYATVVWTLGMAFFWLHFGALLGPQQRPYWIRKIRYGAYALLVLASLGVPLVAMDLSGEVRGMVDPVILGLVWQTQIGQMLPGWWIGGIGLLALAPVAQRWRDHTALVAGALVLIAPSMSGHATDLGGWGRWLVVAHALGWVYWAGSLLPLRWLCGTASSMPPLRATLPQIMIRFGYFGWAYLALLAGSGLILAWALVGDWQTLVGTPYGRLLGFKLLLVALLYAMGARNKWLLVPALQRQEAGALQALKRAINLEILLMGVVLAVAGILASFITLP